MRNYILVTNNPMVRQEAGADHTVDYFEGGYFDFLIYVRRKVQEGFRLLTHPLSGSVKPGETPYKSVLMSRKGRHTDPESVYLINQALIACGKFENKAEKYEKYLPDVLKDFQLIDWNLIQSGMESAETCGWL